MGILSFIRSQFIEIVEWLDDTPYTLVWRFPDEDHEIKNGAKLVCRPGQAAILVNEGFVADIFGPGTHTLSTQNLPVLSRLRGWKYGFASPFKVEIYFFSLRQYLDQKWGTQNPVLIRDEELSVAGRPGRIRIRAYGGYNFKIVDPGRFFAEIVSTQGLVVTEAIEGYLRGRVVSAFSKAVATARIAVMDLAAHYDVIASTVRGDIASAFTDLGLELTTFVIENISLPPEVERAIDAASGQAARGVDNTLAWEAMQALRDGAAREGGGGSAVDLGLGVGVGAGVGQMMSQVFRDAVAPAPSSAPSSGSSLGSASTEAPGSLEDKLRRLKAAFLADLLTEEEYTAKKAALLAAF